MSERDDQLERLSAYLDGELDALAAQELESALQADEDLQAELASLQQTRNLLRGLPAESAPAHFAQDVLRRAERHHHLGRSAPGGTLRSARWIPLAAAAVVLVACGLAMVIIAKLSAPQPLVEELAVGPTPAPALVVDGGDIDTRLDFADAERRPAGHTEALAEVVTEVIWTDDPAEAYEDVRKILVANDVEPVLTDALPSAEIAGRASNVYNMQSFAPDQIQLEVDVDVELAKRLQSDLAYLRSSQRVPQRAQAPVAVAQPTAAPVAPAEDAYDADRIASIRDESPPEAALEAYEAGTASGGEAPAATSTAGPSSSTTEVADMPADGEDDTVEAARRDDLADIAVADDSAADGYEVENLRRVQRLIIQVNRHRMVEEPATETETTVPTASEPAGD